MNLIYRRVALALFGVAVSYCAAQRASAETILLFSKGSTSSSSVSASDLATYGDRVTSSIQGASSFRYGGAANTPNVVVDYGTDESTWTSSYGDLVSVIYTRGVSFGGDDVIKLTLTADPGYRVRLNGFDLAGYPNTDYVTNSVKVFDSANQLIFNQSNVLVHGDAVGPLHTSLAFSPLESQQLRIEIDASNITATFGAQNIGLDNVSFNQVAVPEPTALGAGLLVVVSIVAAGRAKRSRML